MPIASLEKDSVSPGRYTVLIPATFFVFFFLYIWLRIEPRLLYHAFGVYIDWPELSTDRAFLWQSVSHPGGPAEYVAAVLSHWYYYSWAGALIITCLASLLCAGTNALARLAGAARGTLLCYVPAVAILMLYGRYSHLLATLLALLTAVWFSVLYGILPLRRSAYRVGAFVAMFSILYYIAGGAGLLFALLAAIHELRSRRLLPCILILVSVPASPFILSRIWFSPTVRDAYLLLLPFDTKPMLGIDSVSRFVSKALYLLIPLTIALLALRHAISSKRLPASHPKRGASPPQKSFAPLRRPGSKLAARAFVLAVVAVAAACASFNGSRKKSFLVTYCSRLGMWDRLLRAAAQLPLADYDFYCNHQVNRALYHTGRLADRMFSFPQSRAALLLFTEAVPHSVPKFQMLSDTLLDMGNLNLAEQWAHETFEIQGNCPFALEKLALIYLAKDQPEAARVFLNRMSMDLIYHDRAEELLERIDSQPQTGGDPRIQQWRSLGWTEDHAFSVYSEEFMLTNMLKDKKNRMVFEYLMALYLLTRRPEKVVENLHLLDDFGYERIPRHYEEAIMVYSDMTRDKVPLRGRQINPETIRRYKAFVQRYGPLRQNRNAAFAALASDFSDSYFFYHIFRVSGVRQ
ncbi:MAG: hypothetical protein JSU94_07240 [Phycisphaerales bacterium]|nr:MAG: hypothetical protein JSU94_07240 [Phycisphaerales bacterium]